ncbi:MAG TPA: M3 family metallopeptidase, partial [Gammaproteobacteria bacterium]|nr:M3 family metallopeptidase [Gammaproteobacteria bacterium]
SVAQSDSLREAYNICLPLITEYYTLLMQNQSLYQAVNALSLSDSFKELNPAQKKAIENMLRDFHLSGVDLEEDKKNIFMELEKQLSHLSTQFSQNLLDATQAWALSIENKQQLAGLPESTIELLEKNAQNRGLQGWALTLDFPSYSATMKFLDDRELRRKLYEAYATRASDQGPHAGQWNNSAIMMEILSARHQLSHLLGFNNYAEYSLTVKMAKQPATVLQFLNELLNKCKPFAEKEIEELKVFAKSMNGPADLKPWDVSYYAEKMRQAKYNFSEEQIKPYFPINKVLNGLFSLVNNIYGLTLKERHDIETWHSDVKFFDIYDSKNEYRGGFYMDLYARAKKREGAWMDECRVRRRLADGTIQYPIAYLVCNFTPPLKDLPALLTHDEVLTLFHEFGHCLHHLLTKIDYPTVSGINGVPWDAVEFPSQFMELFFWEPQILNMISGHYQTGEPLPEHLYKQLLAAKNFHSGMHMIRQLEFALFDFRIHLEYSGKNPNFIQDILNEVRQHTSLLEVPSFNRFPNSFSHIFAGGYAAGYYSYAWADVLSCDAYGKFEENGLLDRATGESFMQNILEQGGSRDPLTGFIAFRGHEPAMDALIKQNGWK